MHDEYKDYKTPKEAANLIGMSYESVRRAISVGRLPAKKVGWNRLIHIDDITNYIATSHPGPGRKALKFEEEVAG